MKSIFVFLALTCLSQNCFSQSVLMRGSNLGGNSQKSYRFFVGKARVPKRHFVDHPKANHSNLAHHYNGGQSHLAFRYGKSKKGSNSKRRKPK